METHTFTLTKRYWQNRLSRTEEGEDLFDAVQQGMTKYRVSIELTEDEGREVLADTAEVIETTDEPGLRASALEARNAIREHWPHLATENDDEKTTEPD